MSDRRSDIQVGLFSIIGLLLLAMLIMIFGGFKNVLVETYDVTANFDNAAGTAQGTPVRLLGIDVGHVKGVALDPETGGVRMTLAIDRKVDIRRDAPLSIKQEGFIANIYVEFGLGESAETLPKDGTAKVVGKIDTFAAYVERATTVVADMGTTIKSRIGNLSDELIALTGNFNGIVGDEEFQDDLKGLVSNSKDISGTVKDKLPSMMDNFSQAAAKAQESLERSSELLETWQTLGTDLTDLSTAAREQLERQGANMDELTKSLVESADSVATLATSLNDIVETVKAGEGTVGKFFSDTELYRNLVLSIDEIEDASRMIGELAETLKKHPDWLLKGPPEDRR